MNIVGIDIAKGKFDAALPSPAVGLRASGTGSIALRSMVGERVRQAAFTNSEAGFQ
jgi:hypothetical protein